MFSELKTFLFPNPLDKLLKIHRSTPQPRCLIYWNRGLGDIPLGLYALCLHIRKMLPGAKIVFLTRKDLAEAFMLLKDVEVLVDPEMQRGATSCITKALAQHQLTQEMFDLVIEHVDATRWLQWQLGTLVPKLQWHQEWDLLYKAFNLQPSKKYLAVHVSSETSQYYNYEKNWSAERFQELFDRLEGQQEILLLGLQQDTKFHGKHIIDLRGKTTCFEMLSVIKHCACHLLAPDSGVLSIVYYLDVPFPLHLVSLWADPRQGILRQKVASPNPQLMHIPLKGADKCVENISVEQVVKALYCRMQEGYAHGT